MEPVCFSNFLVNTSLNLLDISGRVLNVWGNMKLAADAARLLDIVLIARPVYIKGICFSGES